jgi:hypothetical protein
MDNLEQLRTQLTEAETAAARLSSAIACCKDSTERLRLMREVKAANKVCSTLFRQVARIERTEKLKAQQEARDQLANRQNNACGKSRSRQRDIN